MELVLQVLGAASGAFTLLILLSGFTNPRRRFEE